VEKYCLV